MRNARKALRDSDGRRIRVACRNARRAAQRPALEPAERNGVALVEVLRCVEHKRRAHTAQHAKEQDLSGSEGEWLFVDIDDIPFLAECTPDRARVVEEERGMRAPRSHAADAFAGSGHEVDDASPLREALCGEERDVGPAIVQGAPRVLATHPRPSCARSSVRAQHLPLGSRQP
jgi:hypothetical protein